MRPFVEDPGRNVATKSMMCYELDCMTYERKASLQRSLQESERLPVTKRSKRNEERKK